VLWESALILVLVNIPGIREILFEAFGITQLTPFDIGLVVFLALVVLASIEILKRLVLVQKK